MERESYFLVKTSRILFFMMLIVATMYIAREILIPLVIAALLSFLLMPLQEKLARAGLPNILSIMACLLLLLIIVSGLMFLFYSEVSDFMDKLPELQKHATEKVNTLCNTIEDATGFSSRKQKVLMDKFSNEFSKGQWLGNAFQITGGIFLTFGLIMVYIFCFLFFKGKIHEFFLGIYQGANRQRKTETFTEIKKVSHRYFLGMLTVMAILGTMHSIGLLILGIPDAIFLGYLASLFILAPVVGTMVGSTIPFMVALLTKDSGWYAAGVAAIFCFNLFIESQILTPMIVGSNIKINPMAVIFSIVLGEFIWGIPGMILFIPLIGIIKIILHDTGLFPQFNKLISDNPGRLHLNIMKKIKNRDLNTEARRL